ncbi:hypothetical protein SAMN02949497_3186 [Methylomagnum ishizawai]|uniref:Uncharacterized protein n=1 Tax=Methylomagnum ishizawai TaxID=1760988 RepID=A0A1Y6CZN9_9GAMM|nr:ATP-binding protein [Methylomagnum ishizawai]SMF95811.1 hypothetical protein SAMN02949497_3186 [Methylomagnum ishizawai]
MSPWTPASFSEEYADAAKPKDDFQRFVAELFWDDYPGLVAYQTGGRDGGIDLFQPDQGVVFECKFTSERGFDAALKRWKEVKRHFDTHLTANGPGQSQYAPWFSPTPRITTYLFCLSHELENDSRRQELEREIRSAFVALSARAASLGHLSAIRVEIWCWDRLWPKLQQRPELLLRWFPKLKPPGLDPLDPDEPLKNNFRDYLNPLRLSFMPLPELAVADILAVIDSEFTGLVLHGKGGIGKTRLMREVGLHALREGWAVLLVNVRLCKTESIAQLTQRLAGARILLLLDYLESCPGFDELAAQIDECNARGGHLRLLATCRDSYFAQSPPETLGERNLDALPHEAVITHILEPVPEAERLRTICGGIPIFAVFVRYLHDHKQTDSLRELLADGDFKQWWKKRLPTASTLATGAAKPSSRLFAAYPCADPALDALEQRCPPTGELHRALCQDGWVYQDEGSGLWNLAHDLLADRSLLDELLHATTRRRALRQILDDAETCDFRDSALQALSRIAAELPDTPWFALFQERPEQWKPCIAALLVSVLFSPAEKLRLLEAQAEDRERLAAVPVIANTLGFIARICSKQPEASAGIDQAALRAWLDAAVSQDHPFNFMLTQAVYLDGPRYQAAAQAWLAAHPPSLQTHYLLCAWLRQKLPAEEILSHVLDWLDDWWSSRWATFIFKAWLDATQGQAEFQPLLRNQGVIYFRIRGWLRLDHNRIRPEAEFVFASWLDATQDRALVQDALRDWLAVETNRILPDAEFVFKSWLNATQDRALVQDALRDWLAVETNRILPEARFVFKSWLDATQDRTLVEAALRDWLAVATNRILPEAQFVFKSWLDATQDRVLVQDAIHDWLAVEINRILPEARFVFKSWLDATQDRVLVEAALRDWLAVETNRILPEAQFVFKSWLDATQDRALVQDAICDWLAVETNRLGIEASFVFKSWLDAEGERAFIESEALHWLGHGENAVLSGADFIYRAWGGAEKKLPAPMLSYACAWVRAHQHEKDADFCITHVAETDQLDEQTVRAILFWCDCYFSHPEAINRMGRLGNNLLALTANETITVWEKLLMFRFIKADGIHEWHEFKRLQRTFPVLFRLALRDGDETNLTTLVRLLAWCLQETACFDSDSKPDKGAARDETYPTLMALLLRRMKPPTRPLAQGIRECLAWFDTWTAEEKAQYCGELRTELQNRIVKGWPHSEP